MIGDKKLSTIRAELRSAFARHGYNPLTSLDRRIRKLEKSAKPAATDLRSLLLLRDALAKVVQEKPKTNRRSRTKRPTKAG